ncbi:hypothetical protein [Vibrio parahaemolyticus]|uniref:hypothetical protein n=2 Tax=Vibrio harveyi group TaxID=717610 RepID=UPI0015BD7D5D|nr:hypothetical protein [Vibrio parahaemolyticus]QLE27985.1 hypothetical protein FDP11_21515 [Vibrio parahaemolyticus]HCE1880145.1 hypothetical protein [Vibrio parahaemolyticus]HCE3644821.1 hypothetical protein [Vibrio parahaemolyticus]HCE4534798.1 hypothetical protein [Vibrio parahaemolyticus]
MEYRHAVRTLTTLLGEKCLEGTTSMINISDSIQFGFDVATSITIIATALTWVYTKRQEDKDNIKRDVDEKVRSSALMTINESIKELEPFYVDCATASTSLRKSVDNIIDKPIFEMNSIEIELLINTLSEMVDKEQKLQSAYQEFRKKMIYRLYFIRPVLLSMSDSREILISLEQSVDSKNLDDYTSCIQPLIKIAEIVKAHIDESKHVKFDTNNDIKLNATLSFMLSDEQKRIASTQYKHDLVEHLNVLFNYCKESLLCLSAVSGKMLSKDSRNLGEWKQQIDSPDGGQWAVEDFSEMFHSFWQTSEHLRLNTVLKTFASMLTLRNVTLVSVPVITYTLYARATKQNVTIEEYISGLSPSNFTNPSDLFIHIIFLPLLYAIISLLLVRTLVLRRKKLKIIKWLSKRSDSEVIAINKSFSSSHLCNQPSFKKIYKDIFKKIGKRNFYDTY